MSSSQKQASRIERAHLWNLWVLGLCFAVGCQSPWQTVATSDQSDRQDTPAKQQIAQTSTTANVDSPQGELPPFVELLDVDATVAPHATKSGWLTLTVTNRSRDGVSFIDFPEGAGNDVWKPEIRTASGRLFKYSCNYAPAAEPETVTLEPGESFQRDFQSGAYVSYDDQPRDLKDERCVVAIHYLNRSYAPFTKFHSKKTVLRLSDVFTEYCFE
ncbi:MAG: hypothetical protein H8E37_07115 [Planctomycetes bacterium]|nr:hypothetical protein [Planctomycetota bacterium]